MRRWRVGTVSMGVMLVAVGLLLLIGELQGFNGASLIVRWWPVLLIILGIEILAYIVFSKEEQPKVRFDGLSIFLAILVIMVSTGVYGFNTFMKSGFSQGIFGNMGVYKYETIDNQTYEVDSAKVKKLQMTNSKGKIQVSKYDGSKIIIDTAIVIRSNDEESAKQLGKDLVEITEGETLTVSTKNTSLIENSKNYQIDVNYSVRVPKEMTFDIRNKFGEIELENLIGNAKVVGEFGQVDVKNIKGDVEIENSFGETKIKDVSGKVQADNENGAITFSSKDTVSKDVTLRSKMGSVRVELPRTQQGTFKAYTKFGQINFGGFNSNLDVHTENTQQRLEGVIGNNTPLISVDAEHGGLDLNGR